MHVLLQRYLNYEICEGKFPYEVIGEVSICSSFGKEIISCENMSRKLLLRLSDLSPAPFIILSHSIFRNIIPKESKKKKFSFPQRRKGERKRS